jgi:hypothetical protein
MRRLAFLLRFIAVVQLWFGVLFTFAPGPSARLLGLAPAAPGWASWLLVMMGARFLGYGVGMLAAARDPARHVVWIDTMIGVQLVDLVATIGFLAAGDIPFPNVASALVLPVVFIAGLVAWHPRRLPQPGSPVPAAETVATP